MEFQSWLLFSSIALVATLSPGPAVLLVTTHTIAYGTPRAIFTIVGNICGLFVMSLFSVLGLGALVMLSATLFTLIKWIGGCYLIYLGVRLWRHGFGLSAPADTLSHNSSKTNFRLYIQGLMVALSNPKAIAFTTALFPQFINNANPLLPQFTILVITFMSYSFFCLLLYSLLSINARKKLSNSKWEKRVSRLFGGLFIGAGIGLGTAS